VANLHSPPDFSIHNNHKHHSVVWCKRDLRLTDHASRKRGVSGRKTPTQKPAAQMALDF
jgi:hypothetical protein